MPILRDQTNGISVMMINVGTPSIDPTTTTDSYLSCLTMNDPDRILDFQDVAEISTPGNGLPTETRNNIVQDSKVTLCEHSPTKSPTTQPTEDPTEDPTKDPTTDPTRQPTESPTRPGCPGEMELDLVIVVDTSCAMTPEECERQQFEVAETMTALRNNDFEWDGALRTNNVRISYIETNSGSTESNIIIDLNQNVNQGDNVCLLYTSPSPRDRG